MKKLLIPLLIVLSIIFIGCSVQNEPADRFTLPLRITASLDGSEARFTADIFEGGCDIVFEEGHALSGTVLHLRPDGSTASVGKTLTRDIKNGTFPAQESLITAILFLSATEEKGVINENTARYTIDEMTIMVYYDTNTDSITRIETEEGGRRFGFNIASLEPYEAQSNSGYTP